MSLRFVYYSPLQLWSSFIMITVGMKLKFLTPASLSVHPSPSLCAPHAGGTIVLRTHLPCSYHRAFASAILCTFNTLLLGHNCFPARPSPAALLKEVPGHFPSHVPALFSSKPLSRSETMLFAYSGICPLSAYPKAGILSAWFCDVTLTLYPGPDTL